MNAESVASALGKYLRKSGSGFMALCPAHPDKNPSLSIDVGGGGLLVKCFAGCDQSAVIDALKSRGLWPSKGDALHPLSPTRTKPAAPAWRAILPVPASAPPPPSTHPRHRKPVATWHYRDQAGALLGVVCRFDVDGGKEVIPATWCTDGNRSEWRWQALPEPRPLFGLDQIGDAQHVLVVEGEKSADAARRLLGDRLPVVTWSGGCNAVAKSDWSPLAGKAVAIWPDADAPGAKAASAVAETLERHGCHTKIIPPPAGAAAGWDAADAEAEGWAEEQVVTLIEAALEPGAFRAKHDLPTQGQVGEDGLLNEDPLLFDDLATPEIPATLLPGWLGDFAGALARSTQTPPAMAVMMTLAVAAACAAKRFEVETGHVEPLNLWTVAVMPPASRKTAVKNAATAPLVSWEAEQAKALAPKIQDNAIRRRACQHRIEYLQKQAAKEADPLKRSDLAKEILNLHNEMPPEIVSPRLFTSDCTPEQMQMLLAEHGERMAVISDEGGIFEIMAGLYTGGSANIDVFLQGHAGGAVRADRASRRAHLDAPAVSFGLAVQPSILAEMGTGGKRRFRGNGLLARPLYAVPRSNVGNRDVRAVYRIPENVRAAYHAGLSNFLTVKPQMADGGGEIARRLTMTADALDSWHAFAEMVERRQGTGGDLEGIADWSGKLPGQAQRIAGIFHLVEHGPNPPAQIEVATIELALDLCALLIDHAKAAFGMMAADPATADAKAIFTWVTERRATKFTRGELWPAFKGRFTGNTERLDRALNELVRRRIVTPTTEPTRGRPATAYTVNPAVWS